MKRRNFIAGLGTMVSTSAIFGTGAFTNVSANREVTVAVAHDYNAYLKLTQRGNGRRSYTDGGADEIGFDIPSPDDDDYGGTDPEGLGRASVYRFGQDAAGDEDGLFDITNQGTQSVQVFGSQETTEGLPSVSIYDINSGEILTEDDPSGPLGVGETIVCGLEIDTHGVEVRESEYEIVLTINAVEDTT